MQGNVAVGLRGEGRARLGREAGQTELALPLPQPGCERWERQGWNAELAVGNRLSFRRILVHPAQFTFLREQVGCSLAQLGAGVAWIPVFWEN